MYSFPADPFKSFSNGIVWRFKTKRYAMVEYWFVFLMIVSHRFSFPWWSWLLSWRSHAVSAANQQAEGTFARAWGAESPPRSAGNEHPAGWLFNRENLALRENNSPSSCVSPAAVAAANCLIRFVCAEWGVGYKVDISKTKAVIKWIQLYPTYNHRYGLMISSLLSSEGQTPRRCAAMATAFLTSSSLSESSPPLSRLLQ